MTVPHSYENQPKYPVAVDCVIFGYEEEELKLLLYPRGFAPMKGSWSLMGGFVQDEESMEQTISRVIHQTVGLHDIFFEQVGVYSDPERDPGGRVISMSCYALIRINEHDRALVEEKGGKWFSITQFPPLVFDHNRMVSDALSKLRQKASNQLIGKALLPHAFTLTQLHRLYNAIFQKDFNAGNFRKKISSLDTLNKLDAKDTSSSKRGAYLYQFKEDADDQQLERIVKI